jgi:hypothetical protein
MADFSSKLLRFNKIRKFHAIKDIKELQEFLESGDIISKVKESTESAFREHSDILRGFISEQAKK